MGEGGTQSQNLKALTQLDRLPIVKSVTSTCRSVCWGSNASFGMLGYRMGT